MKQFCVLLCIALISLGCSGSMFGGRKGKSEENLNGKVLERGSEIEKIVADAIFEGLERTNQPLDILFMVQGGKTMVSKGYDLIDTFKSFMENLDSNTDWRIAVTSDDATAGCVQVIKNTGVRGVEAKLYIEKSDYEKDSDKAITNLVDTIVNPGARSMYLREGLFNTLKGFNLFINEPYYQYINKDTQTSNCDKWYRDKSRVVGIFISDVDNCARDKLPATCEIINRTLPVGTVTSTCADADCKNLKVVEIKSEDKCNEVRKFNPKLAEECEKDKSIKYYTIEGLKCKKDSSGSCIKSSASTEYYSKNTDGTKGTLQARVLHYVYQEDLNQTTAVEKKLRGELEGKTCKIVRSVKNKDSSGNPIKNADGTYSCNTPYVTSNSDKIVERECAIEHLSGHKYRPEDYNSQEEFDKAVDEKREGLTQARYKCMPDEDGKCFLSEIAIDPQTNKTFNTLDTIDGCKTADRPKPDQSTLETYGSLKSYFIGMHSPNSSKDVFLTKMQKFRDITDMRFYGFLNLTSTTYDAESKHYLFDDDPEQYGYDIAKNSNGTYTVRDLNSKTYRMVIDATGGLIKDIKIINDISEKPESLDAVKKVFKEISSNIALFTNTKYKLKVPARSIDRLFLGKDCLDDGNIKNCKELLEIDRSFASSDGTGVDLSKLDPQILKQYNHLVYTLQND